MRYREIPPAPRLRPFVESFWMLECDGGPAQRVVPDGHPELILNVGEPFEYLDERGWVRQPKYFFAGQIRGPLLLRPSGHAQILGIRFTPHGAPALLEPPMNELAGRFTALGDVSPRLQCELEHALDSRDVMKSVEGALSRAISARGSDRAIALAVREIRASQGAAGLAELASGLNLSSRQFERRFNAAVGLSPKMFCSLERFTQVFRAISVDRLSWVNTALACGYYDQAHLIRDFKRFSGETPAVLLAPEADLARHFLSRFGVSHSSNTNGRAAM
jgi:AraC-like DNA-binding protein